jgi:hypothetical protein
MESRAEEKVSAFQVDGQVFLLQDRHGFPRVTTRPGGVNAADLLPPRLIGSLARDVVAIL